jgi:hypothetical protein
MNSDYIKARIDIKGIAVPVISSGLNLADHLGAMMVRWNINRNNYRVMPGLYAIGNPDTGSDVFVSANYKLSFDSLRSSLEGINGWILVLDTRGVNVWCAAGKGTFGTKELVSKIRQYSLENIVSHRRLIVPQLGATGVAAHKVREETGFNVHYGPVRACDIKKFISNGYRKDREMSLVTFGFRDRMTLVPNDFIYGKFYLLGAIAVMISLSFLGKEGFNPAFSKESYSAVLNVSLAYIGGIVITPALLPYIPARAFAVKGFYTGVFIYIISALAGFSAGSTIQLISWFLIIGAISSFMAMNFTGSSTFTSLSGVRKEMRIAVPVQIACAASGLALNIIGKFI